MSTNGRPSNWHAEKRQASRDKPNVREFSPTKAEKRATRINQEELIRRLLEQHAHLKKAFDKIGPILHELSALSPYVDPVIVTGRRLDEYGDVLTLNDIAAIIQRSPRFVRWLEKAQKETAIRCLPEEIPGLKRYTKQAVAQWFKSGLPAIVLENVERPKARRGHGSPHKRQIQ